jgi:hypothetical protein
MRLRFVLLTLGLLVPLTGGQAQERPGMPDVARERLGMPDVMTPGPRSYAVDVANGSIEQFGNWARRAGNPRILLFWNTAFSDETSTRSRLVSREDSVTKLHRDGVTRSREATIEDERTTGGTVHWLERGDEAELENAFVSTFAETNANLVDRAAVMRKASVRQDKSDRVDQQYMEALALEQGIDYLIEVLPEYAAGTASGLRFAVKVLHVPSSRIVARFSSEARPTPGPERLVARSGGFRRERDDNLSAGAIGRTLAAETMRSFR